jgi:hypothetical protein
MSTPDPWAADPDGPSLNENPGVTDVQTAGRHLIVGLADGTSVTLAHTPAPEMEAEPG